MCISCTKFAALVPRFIGGTSTISSSIIIYTIFVSQSKLKTVYHRIMFGMSVADILSSVAMGLTTLPMPKGDPLWIPKEDLRTYDGTRLGNIYTCEAQGFMYVFGFIVMFAYNDALFVYYGCAIAFCMKESNIVKFIEPFLHLTPVAIGLTVATTSLVGKLYNPTTWDAWCTIAAGELTESRVNMTNIDNLVRYLTIVLFSVILLSGSLIIWRVRKTTRALRGPMHMRRLPSSMERAKNSVQSTKIVAIQALAYFVSFMTTIGILLIRAVIIEPYWVIKLSFVLMPLQGFFNAVIFISHKVYNYRRANSDVSRGDVIRLIFKGGIEEPVLVSRISHVHINQNRRMEIEITDEYSNHFVEHQEPVSASQSGEHVFVDDYSVGDVEDLSGFSSSKPESNMDKKSLFSGSKGGLSGFSSVLSSK